MHQHHQFVQELADHRHNSHHVYSNMAHCQSAIITLTHIMYKLFHFFEAMALITLCCSAASVLATTLDRWRDSIWKWIKQVSYAASIKLYQLWILFYYPFYIQTGELVVKYLVGLLKSLNILWWWILSNIPTLGQLNLWARLYMYLQLYVHNIIRPLSSFYYIGHTDI